MGLEQMLKVKRSLLHRPLSAPSNQAPNDQYDYRAHNRSNEAGSLVCAVPADRLPQISGDKRPDDPEDRGQDEARRLVVSRRDQFRDHTRDKSNDDRPDDTQVDLSAA
jgi:hypothetical protein